VRYKLFDIESNLQNQLFYGVIEFYQLHLNQKNEN